MMAAFLSAFVTTFVVGAIARFGAAYFASDRTAAVAAFGVAIGFALGRYSWSGPVSIEAAIAASAAAGSIIALVGLWTWLLRTSAEDSSESS